MATTRSGAAGPAAQAGDASEDRAGQLGNARFDRKTLPGFALLAHWESAFLVRRRHRVRFPGLAPNAFVSVQVSNLLSRNGTMRVRLPPKAQQPVPMAQLDSVTAS